MRVGVQADSELVSQQEGRTKIWRSKRIRVTRGQDQHRDRMQHYMMCITIMYIEVFGVLMIC